jgi:hypothetical protein
MSQRSVALCLLFSLATACGALLGHEDDIQYRDDSTDGGGQSSSGASGGPLDSGKDASNADGGNTSCGDTKSSATNCGQCGRSCQGKACKEGACVPEEIIAGINDPVSLTALGGSLFWTLNGSAEIFSCTAAPAPGCTSTSQFPNAFYSNSRNLTHDATRIYWSAANGVDPNTGGGIQGGVIRCIPGSCTTTFDKAPQSQVTIAGLWVGPTYLLFTHTVVTNLTDPVVRSTRLNNDPATLATYTDSNGPTFITSAADTAVWVSNGATRLMKCPLSIVAGQQVTCASAPTVLIANRQNIGRVVASGNEVFWIEGATSNVIARCSVAACVTPTTHATATSAISELVAVGTDNKDLYFGAGGIYHCTTTDCQNPRLLARTTGQPRSIAADAETKDYVYWVEPGGIYRTPK